MLTGKAYHSQLKDATAISGQYFRSMKAVFAFYIYIFLYSLLYSLPYFVPTRKTRWAVGTNSNHLVLFLLGLAVVGVVLLLGLLVGLVLVVLRDGGLEVARLKKAAVTDNSHLLLRRSAFTSD